MATEKMVMASALRAIGLRHRAWVRYRSALISEPAWPISIQNTKLIR